MIIAMYTSTKGHFGNKNIYKETVKSLDDRLLGVDKIVHIKYSKGDEDQLANMTQFFDEHNWKVINTKGEWSHGDGSHAIQYYKDKLTLFSHPLVQKHKYALFIEDDWLINRIHTPLLEKAESFLSNNLNKLCVRFNAKGQKVPDFTFETKDHLFCSQGPKATRWGPTMTFQPTVVRTTEWYHAVKWINNTADNDPDLFNNIHCELISGQAMKRFSDDPQPFCFFNDQMFWAEHIGYEDYCNKS